MQGIKRKHDTEIIAAETQAEMSNICDQEPEPLKMMMMRQMKAQLSRQAAAKASCKLFPSPLVLSHVLKLFLFLSM